MRNLAGGQRCLRETSLEIGAQLEDLSLQKSRTRGLPDELHLEFVESRYYCERSSVYNRRGTVFALVVAGYKCLGAFWHFDSKRLTLAWLGLAALTQLGSTADFGEIMVDS